MPTHGADEQHARLLSSLHEEFLAYGLISTQDASLFRSPSSGGFTQSSAGAFPPLQYLDRQGRKIVVRALAMFDDLIVNTTVSSGSMSAASASPSAAAREGGGGVEGKGDVVVLSRRVTFEVPFWLEEEGAADRPEEDEVTTGYCTGKREQNQHNQSPPSLCGVSSQAPQREGAGRTPSRKELFQTRVLSGLLLHLCPPPGQFADLFGVEESLRSRVLGMLGARDLATFGLTSRAAAVSAAADSLWAPLVAAEFSEREQHAVLFLQSSPPPCMEPLASANDNGDSRANTGSDGDTDGIDSASTASSASPSKGSTVDEVEDIGGARDQKSHSEGSDHDECCGSGGDGGADLAAGDGIRCSGNNSSSSGSNSNSGGCAGNVRGKEGASRRLYIKLHEARMRRAAIAAEQRRRSTILEMSALGRLGRAWGLYPWAPYLPRGPHYSHSSGPAFPEYNWGPGIGPGPGPGPGAGSTPDGPEAVAHAHPHPMWGSGTGWGRSRSGPWRGFSGGGMGVCPGGVGIGGSWGVTGQGGSSAAPHGQGRRNRGRFVGHFSAL